MGSGVFRGLNDPDQWAENAQKFVGEHEARIGSTKQETLTKPGMANHEGSHEEECRLLAERFGLFRQDNI